MENVKGVEANRALTIGEKLVGVSFNPSKNPKVDEAKQLMARAIDLLQESHNEKTNNGAAMASHERNILRTHAVTEVINAQMAVVKYITWED